VGRAARELAQVLTLQRAQAEIQRGASERSRRLRNELRANAGHLEVPGMGDLLERLLQVAVEDYDGRSGWRAFDDARRRLRRAQSEGERRDAAIELTTRGTEVFGLPVEEDPVEETADVKPEHLQLVAYEALVGAEPVAASPADEQLPMDL
jgi:hypothetical protein